MSTIENRELVEATWAAFVRGDVKEAFSHLDDGVTWSIPGTIPELSGVKRGKKEIFAFLGAVSRVFPAGLRSETRAVHAAGEAVIVEMTNRGTTAGGKAYENQYCFVFEVVGGKIRAIREYVDTQKAAALLGV